MLEWKKYHKKRHVSVFDVHWTQIHEAGGLIRVLRFLFFTQSSTHLKCVRFDCAYRWFGFLKFEEHAHWVYRPPCRLVLIRRAKRDAWKIDVGRQLRAVSLFSACFVKAVLMCCVVLTNFVCVLTMQPFTSAKREISVLKSRKGFLSKR